MTTLRLLADDLTGALDTAAEFVGMTGPVDAFWHGGIPTVLPTSAALDSGTRELDPDAAMPVIAKLASALSGVTIAFKKVDSLMRGPAFAEIATCMRAGGWRYAVMAPAFPYQGRATRGGIQYARGMQGDWAAVSDNLVSRLQDMGLQAHIGRPNAPLPPGISVFDADTDADLDRIVAACGAADPVLWIGTGGIAQALARGTPSPANRHLPLPLLGLFGSDHAVTARQLAACGTDWTMLRDGSPAEVQSVAERLRATEQVVASLELPLGLDRTVAAGRIAAALHRLVRDRLVHLWWLVGKRCAASVSPSRRAAWRLKAASCQVSLAPGFAAVFGMALPSSPSPAPSVRPTCCATCCAAPTLRRKGNPDGAATSCNHHG